MQWKNNRCLKNSGDCCGIASEENGEIIPLKGEGVRILNIRTFGPFRWLFQYWCQRICGTIFSIYERLSPVDKEVTSKISFGRKVQDKLQPDMFCTELQQYWFIQPEKE